MADEQTASDTSAPEMSMEDRVFEKLFGPDEPEAAPEPTAEAEPEADADDELALVDDPESTIEAAPAPADELEIVYNGTPEKLPKAEAVRLAQMGRHLEQNQQRFEQQWKSVETYAQASQQAAALAPEVQEAMSLATLYQRAIEGIDRNALAQLARQDPAAYVERAAELEQLQYQHQQAQARANEAQHKHSQAVQYRDAQWEHRQEELLTRAIPQWRDQAKRSADATAIFASMQEIGYTAQELQGVKDARAKHLMHLATKYLTLQKAKGEQLKRANAAPPVVKPGVATSAKSTAAERDERLGKAIKSAKTPAEKARFIQARIAARL